jgi:dTDP-4-dehydrorhamnose 3,5-epimerase-like enzyme
VTDDLLPGCRLVPLAVRGDARGSLVAIEGGRDVPFAIARVYYVFGTTAGVDRGLHAHHKLRQLAIPVAGSCTMLLDDGQERVSVRLDNPAQGLSMGPLIWREMTDFSPDCVLMVLADAVYDEADYMRDYDEFLAAVAAAK